MLNGDTLNRTTKIILVSLAVILIGSYVYFSYIHDWFANDVLIGSFITNQLISDSGRTIICPEGYMEGQIETISGVDITLSEPIQTCFSNTIHDPSHPDYSIVCGDVFVNTEGNVESVECGK